MRPKRLHVNGSSNLEACVLSLDPKRINKNRINRTAIPHNWVKLATNDKKSPLHPSPSFIAPPISADRWSANTRTRDELLFWRKFQTLTFQMSDLNFFFGSFFTNLSCVNLIVFRRNVYIKVNGLNCYCIICGFWKNHSLLLCGNV